ncbi:MarR family transcriptional regulator [Mesorhizobium sp. BR1-1-13]|uniref:MarR family transcriptional regulator n=1 Tax=Mesorhizobium sp. BR1-1-13 TaxID=2876656 RepID=UPI001CD1493E|nr:helix-turn-helix domain-containing protein [Mesorhizobium sp. BR1-1-13]MBZ9942426.1 MarR family transcriptional regulator [Mesorhizobium sp. BR1-1-13]
MDNRARIANFIMRFPGRDDDQISTALKITPRQTVNQICRELANAGVVERRPNASGKLANYPSGIQGDPLPSGQAKEQMQSNGAVDATAEWFWEGNVANAVASYLLQQGWSIISLADTGKKERGLDIHAVRLKREIMIEVKGYPSRGYRDPNRSSETKPTNPSLQAQHWFAHALLKALRMQSAHPTAQVAIALPDFPRYRSLFNETASALQRLGVATFFVAGLSGACRSLTLSGEIIAQPRYVREAHYSPQSRCASPTRSRDVQQKMWGKAWGNIPNR